MDKKYFNRNFADFFYFGQINTIEIVRKLRNQWLQKF